MGTWTMGWGDDGVSSDPPLLPYEDWAPRSVPRGAARTVSVVLRGLHDIPDSPVVVAWDDHRATIRLPTGKLCWYIDGTSLAFPQDGGITVTDIDSAYPRGNRYMDALAVRSLQDLIEIVNAETVTSIDEDGTIRIVGEHDNSRATVVREPDSGVILRASGTEGHRKWSFKVIESRLLEQGQGLLEPTDLAEPCS